MKYLELGSIWSTGFLDEAFIDQGCTRINWSGTKMWSTPVLIHLSIESFGLDLVLSSPDVKEHTKTNFFYMSTLKIIVL